MVSRLDLMVMWFEERIVDFSRSPPPLLLVGPRMLWQLYLPNICLPQWFDRQTNVFSARTPSTRSRCPHSVPPSQPHVSCPLLSNIIPILLWVGQWLVSLYLHSWMKSASWGLMSTEFSPSCLMEQLSCTNLLLYSHHTLSYICFKWYNFFPPEHLRGTFIRPYVQIFGVPPSQLISIVSIQMLSILTQKSSSTNILPQFLAWGWNIIPPPQGHYPGIKSFRCPIREIPLSLSCMDHWMI